VCRRSDLRPAKSVAALSLAVVVAVVAFVYRGPIVSYVRHWGGSPTTTEPLRAYAPGERPLARLAVVGDIGYPGGRLEATAGAVERAHRMNPFDALVSLGDNVYPNGDPERLDATLFRPFASVLRDARLLAIVGNHDVLDGHRSAQLERLGMPGPWWAAAVGPVLVVGLDSTQTADEAQTTWLERTLSETTQPWRIVLVHHPPYSAGYQGSSHDVRDRFGPLFERYGVQLVLSGHDHDYQRSRPIGGVTYVVSGGASETRRTGRASFTAFSASWHHFVTVDVFADRLVVRAVNQDVRIFDEATILHHNARNGGQLS
jgi:3',5'-cyclic AMP phosphodiesterase CpdA